MSWWAQLLIATGVSVLVAVAVPLAIEYVRRPILRVEVDDEPVPDAPLDLVHVWVRNLPMSERRWLARLLGRWLTALPADGCSLTIVIFRDEDDVIVFDGKWTSRVEPIATHLVPTGSGVERLHVYDPQKLPGIHEVRLLPGRGDLVAIAIREPRDAPSAYAYWAERIYADAGGLPFPEHPDAELPPGIYHVEVRASAGELHSPWMMLALIVEPSDGLTLREVLGAEPATGWRRVYRIVSSRIRSR